MYLYSCAGFNVTETSCQAKAKRNYTSWPNLPLEYDPVLVQKYLSKLKETTIEHMKAIQSNTRSTTRVATKKNKDGYSSKDKDDGTITILDLPRTHLEFSKGCHIAFRSDHKAMP